MQVGNHNTQTNHFAIPRQPLTPAHLTELDPASAARRLLREDPDEAAVLVATSASAVAVLEAMLPAGEEHTLAVLTCMHPAKAKQLIDRLTHTAPWLADLLAATAAIRRVHGSSRDTLGDEAGAITRAGPRGFRLPCTSGTIYWSPDAGAVPVHGPFLTYYDAAGGPAGRLGFPLRAASGGGQQFEDSLVVVTSGHGTFTTELPLYRKKFLGAPLSEAVRLDFGWRQSFEHGDVDTDDFGGVFVVAEDIRAALRDTPWRKLRACADRARPVSSIYGTRGAWQRFGPSRAEVVVYVAGQEDTAVLSPQIEAIYQAAGGPGGWLGFPRRRRSSERRPFSFEGGVITGGFAVPHAIFMAAHGLGAPTGDVEPLGTGGDQAQCFDYGMVTVRGEQVQAWTRISS
ncbi:hypothetical protein GCM10009827_047110 [Dactylosporangium maewongense]|uniref:Uncharacterized protein n=2 Tax=Micromonosporaceae TaxID=28056 RepID=A0ABN2AQY3_9ACTN